MHGTAGQFASGTVTFPESAKNCPKKAKMAEPFQEWLRHWWFFSGTPASRGDRVHTLPQSLPPWLAKY
jgi:hypothetical protein